MKGKGRIIRKLLCLGTAAIMLAGTMPVFGQEQEEALDIQWLSLAGEGFHLDSTQRISDQEVVKVDRLDSTGEPGYFIVDLAEGTVSEPLSYEWVEPVSEGMAAVADYSYETVTTDTESYQIVTSAWGYVDARGRLVIPQIYERAENFRQGYAIVSKLLPEEGTQAELTESGMVEKYGIIDKQGNVAVDFIYDSIFYMDEGIYEASIRGNEAEGVSGKTGILRTDGTFTEIPGSYLLYQDPYVVAIDDEASTATYYNGQGEQLAPPFESSGSYYDLTEEPSLVPVKDRQGKWGIYDMETGEMAIDYQYDILSHGGFMNGLIGAGYEGGYNEETGTYDNWRMGYVDREGNQVIPFIYGQTRPFYEGLAVVETLERQSGVNVGVGMIDTQGDPVLPIGFSFIGDCQGGTIPASWQNSPYGFYNAAGEKITPYKYSAFSAPSEGVRWVSVDQEDGSRLYGAINAYGNEIIPVEYTAMTTFYNGRALVGEGVFGAADQGGCERVGIIQRPASADYDTGQVSFISVLLDGTPVSFDQDPLMANDRVLVPMRAIFEAIGAQVSWDGEKQKVTGKKDGLEIELTIGDTIAYAGGEVVELDSPAILQGGRTLVPVRFVAESLKADVDWDQENLTVIIETQK